jgi:hypothetical protein
VIRYHGAMGVYLIAAGDKSGTKARPATSQREYPRSEPVSLI